MLNREKKIFIFDLLERKRLVKSYHKGEITKEELTLKGVNLVNPMNIKTHQNV